jgi:hypothetical protein
LDRVLLFPLHARLPRRSQPALFRSIRRTPSTFNQKTYIPHIGLYLSQNPLQKMDKQMIRLWKLQSQFWAASIIKGM